MTQWPPARPGEDFDSYWERIGGRSREELVARWEQIRHRVVVPEQCVEPPASFSIADISRPAAKPDPPATTKPPPRTLFD